MGMKDEVCKFLVNASGKCVYTNLAYTLPSLFSLFWLKHWFLESLCQSYSC